MTPVISLQNNNILLDSLAWGVKISSSQDNIFVAFGHVSLRLIKTVA